MEDQTWGLLERWFAEWPRTRASGASDQEIDAAARVVGVSFPADYREFLKRYGSGIVGAYPILGIHKSPAMADDAWSLEGLNREYRSKKWPDIDGWLIFSIDLAGNPIGFTGAGRVSVSDGEFHEIDELAPDFETYLRQCCLEAG